MFIHILKKNMSESRSTKSIRNVTFIAVSKLLQMLLTFAVRTILIKNLGVEILGLDGLFSSVVTVLSIADLGLGSAVIYSLYKPIAEKDERLIAAYISFFDKVYSIIGCIILVFGILSIPFLKYLVNLDTPVNNVELIYILMIASTAATYFFSSRRIIYEADQSSYKTTLIDFIFNIGLQVTQIIIILLFKEYIIVLIIRAIFALLNNIAIYLRGNARYKYLTKYQQEKLGRENIVGLWKNTGVIMCHKVGGVLVSGVDNMIISSFIGTLYSGYYSNYLLVITSITSFITLGLNALVPSVGNLRATTENAEHHYRVFKEILLTNYIMSAFASVMLYVELDNLINIWVGTDFLLEKDVVLLLCINFYISTMRYGCGAFNTAAGYFKQTLIKPIAEGIINLIVSIALVRYIGMLGVFLGTTTSLMLGSVWVDPYVLYRNWFKKSSLEYFGQYAMMLILTSGIGAIIHFAGSIYVPHNFFELVTHAVACALICMILVFMSALILPGRRDLSQRVRSMIVSR